MSRRRFYAPPEAPSRDKKSVTLSAAETRHARDVLRLQHGEEVYLFDGEGQEYRCVIAQLSRETVKLDILEQVEPPHPESRVRLTLCVDLLTGEQCDLVMQRGTACGET